MRTPSEPGEPSFSALEIFNRAVFYTFDDFESKAFEALETLKNRRLQRRRVNPTFDVSSKTRSDVEPFDFVSFNGTDDFIDV